MSKFIKLGDKEINEISAPYIIAEIGVNHEGSLSTAKHLIDLAKEGGADAAKFQSYKADKIASKNSPSYWDTTKESTTSQHELFKKYDNFNVDDFYKLYEHCENNKIDFLSTPFDHNAVDFLDAMVPFFKISSSDITNLPLLRKVSEKKKPIVLSTGASNLEEISNAVNIIESISDSSIALLHCILNYPTIDKNANLSMIKSLIKSYPDKIVGYSDHTLPNNGMIALITAYTMGAVIIEKHFTNDKNLKGNDHYHAMDVEDLKELREKIKQINILQGNELIKKPIKTEEISILNARRSIYALGDISKGTVLTEKNLICKRPGTGIEPKYWDKILGKKVKSEILDDTLIDWSNLN